jgi:hypothetical protein
VNPDTEQTGYHAQRVTDEQVRAAVRLIARMCPDPAPVLHALGLAEPRTAVRQPAGPPQGADAGQREYCRNGHVRTRDNTGLRRRAGRAPQRYCRTCETAATKARQARGM